MQLIAAIAIIQALVHQDPLELLLLLLPVYHLLWIHVCPWLCCLCLPLQTGNPAQAMFVAAPGENLSVFIASQIKKNGVIEPIAWKQNRTKLLQHRCLLARLGFSKGRTSQCLSLYPAPLALLLLQVKVAIPEGWDLSQRLAVSVLLLSHQAPPLYWVWRGTVHPAAVLTLLVPQLPRFPSAKKIFWNLSCWYIEQRTSLNEILLVENRAPVYTIKGNKH